MSLEDRFRQVLESAIAEVRTRLESEFTTSLSDVRGEAERDKGAALAALEEIKAAELTAAHDARTTADSDTARVREEMSAELERLRAEAAAEADRLRAEAEATATRLREESESALSAVRSELQQVLADGARQREELEAALATAKQEAVDAADRAMLEHEAAVAQAREALDVALAQSREAHEAHEAALAKFHDDHAGTVTAAQNAAQEAASAHSQALDAQLSGAIRLLESVRGLDGASSLTEVLDSLTVAAAKEVGRAAMLVVKGDRLIGWRAAGFGSLDDEPRSIESSTADVGALAAAVNTGRPAVVGSGSVLAAPSFSQLPADRPGLAVPLLVAGRPVAVLYADPGASLPLSSGWTSPVEVLVRHAGRCLEAIAVQRGAHAKAAAARVGTPA